jgi:hypothetical protein
VFVRHGLYLTLPPGGLFVAMIHSPDRSAIGRGPAGSAGERSADRSPAPARPQTVVDEAYEDLWRSVRVRPAPLACPCPFEVTHDLGVPVAAARPFRGFPPVVHVWNHRPMGGGPESREGLAPKPRNDRAPRASRALRTRAERRPGSRQTEKGRLRGPDPSIKVRAVLDPYPRSPLWVEFVGPSRREEPWGSHHSS